MLGYTILYVFSYFTRVALLQQAPLWVPIYTEDGYTTLNPAVGYYDVMFAPICYDNPTGPLGEACIWDHGPNNITIVDNEYNIIQS